MKQFYQSLALSMMLICAMSTYAQPEKYLEFNGKNQYVKIPSHSDFDVKSGQSLTVTCWVYVNKLVMGQRFVSRRVMYEPSNTPGYELWGGNTSDKYFAVNTAKTGGGNVFSDWCKYGEVDAKNWMHLAMVIDKQNKIITLYRDGVKGNEKSSNEFTNWEVTKNDIYIGACAINGSDTPGFFLNGRIADVRIYNIALTADEIATDMNNPTTSATQGLVASYDFANIQGQTVPDISGHGHDGTLYGYEQIDSDGALEINSLQADNNFTGRGNKNETAAHIKCNVKQQENYPLNSITLDCTGTTDIQDIENLKIYGTEDENFDTRKPESATLIVTLTPQEGENKYTLNSEIPTNVKNLWITYDIKDEAKEGNRVIVTLKKLNDITLRQSQKSEREILLGRKLLFAPGDYGSKNYRIPALITAWDGSLVALTDKRKNNQADIPQDIDIVAKRSTDNGKTWSEPILVAQGQGYKKGYGDVAVVRTNTPNQLLAIFIGGNGLFASSPQDRIRTYISRSNDNGQTWSAPQDITDQVFSGERSAWNASFCAAGNGICTRNGVLMFASAMRHESGNTLYNHVIYSNDNGQTWNVSNCSLIGGDEAKLVETNDGRIIMSIRRPSRGKRYYNISQNIPTKDQPVVWETKDTSNVPQWNEIIEPACNGDIIRYTSTLDGFDKNRILHSVPDDPQNRRNVSIYLSYDEAQTWTYKKSICHTGSAYSSLAILSDGTIGIFTEENDNTQDYSMYFTNVSLKWLTDGNDTYTQATGQKKTVAPAFSHTAKKYKTPQKVTISCAMAEAIIYYTTDGTDPTVNSTRYSDPIDIAQDMTIKAIAVKDGFEPSDIVTQSYEIKPGWDAPEGTVHSTEQRYVTSATTTGAIQDLDYNLSTCPITPFIDTQAALTVNRGNTFTLNVKSTEDMKWCHAIIFIDWNGDYDFDDDGEQMPRIGVEGYNGNISETGNPEVADFIREITVPADAKVGETRLRIQFTDAWHSGVPNHTHTAVDAIDRGGCYDFILHIKDQTDDIRNIDATAQDITISPQTNGCMIQTPDPATLRIYNTAGALLKRTPLLKGKNQVTYGTSSKQVLILNIKNAKTNKTVKVQAN